MDDREFLTDEEIASEKQLKINFRKNKMRVEIDRFVQEFESRACAGRINNRPHYMRKIVRWDKLADERSGRYGEYGIKCEFCDISGILVKEKTYEVINLGNCLEKNK